MSENSDYYKPVPGENLLTKLETEIIDYNKKKNNVKKKQKKEFKIRRINIDFEEEKITKQPITVSTYLIKKIGILAIIWSICLSLTLTYKFNWNAGTTQNLREDLTPIVPHHLEADSLIISKNGILYEGFQYDKELILKINKDVLSRGLTLKILNQPNWIDLISKALNNEITFESLTHDGVRERWLAYDGILDKHMHDPEGAKYRKINQNNTIMVGRGITHLVINSTNYLDDQIYEFQIIQEQMVSTDWWIQYKYVQMLTGFMGFGLQASSNFNIQSQLTNLMMYFIIAMAILEKIDFIKDIYVAAVMPHASVYHGFIFWMSICLPTFGILFYFIAINRMDQFLPTFFGYTELIKDDEQGDENQHSLNEMLVKQGKIMTNYKMILAPDLDLEKQVALAKEYNKITKIYEKAAEILQEIKRQMEKRVIRFFIAGLIIIIENVIQMIIFYDDQLTVGNTWTWQTAVMPMLSNVLFSRFCATLGPALWTILKNNKELAEHRLIISLIGHILGLGMCIGIQITMYIQIGKHQVDSQPAYIEFRENTPVNWNILMAGYSFLAIIYIYIGYKFFKKLIKYSEQQMDRNEIKNMDQTVVDSTGMNFISVFINDDIDNLDYDWHYQFYNAQRRIFTSMKMHDQKKWEEFIFNYQNKIVPKNIASDYKMFEFYFYLKIEPSNEKYQQISNETELKEIVEIYSKCQKEFKTVNIVNSIEVSQKTCIQFLELFEQCKKYQNSVINTIQFLKTTHQLFLTWKKKANTDFENFVNRQNECSKNDADFEKVMNLYEDWKQNINKEGKLNEYVDLVKEYKYDTEFIETGQNLFKEWETFIDYSFTEYIALIFPYAGKVHLDITMIQFKKYKEIVQNDAKYIDLFQILEKYNYESEFLTKSLEMQEKYENEIGTGFDTFAQFLENSKKYNDNIESLSIKEQEKCLNIEQSLKLFSELTNIESKANYKEFLEITSKYYLSEEPFNTILKHLKNWKEYTQSNFAQFIHAFFQYKGQGNIDFEESLKLFKKWKDNDSRADYNDYLKIVKDEKYRLNIIEKKLVLFIKFKSQIEISFTKILPEFKKWVQIDNKASFLIWLELNVQYKEDSSILTEQLELYEKYMTEINASQSYSQYLEIITQYKSKIEIKRTFEQFKIWNSIEQEGKYEQYLQIMDDYDYQEQFLTTSMQQLKQLKQVIRISFTRFLEISKKYENQFDFEKILEQFKKWMNIKTVGSIEANDQTFFEFLVIVIIYQDNIDIDKSLELFKEWHSIESEGQYNEFLEICKKNRPEFINDLLSKSIKLLKVWKPVTGYKIQQLLDITKKYGAVVNYEEILKLFIEWNKIESKATCEEFLEISQSYEYQIEHLSQSLNLLKEWKQVTNYDIRQFLEITKEHRDTVDYEETLKLFKKWKEVKQDSNYKEFLVIIKGYNDKIINKAIILWKNWRWVVINNELIDFLKIVKYYETDAYDFDFNGTLNLFTQWIKFQPDDTYEQFLQISKNYHHDINFIRQQLELYYQHKETFGVNITEFLIISKKYQGKFARLIQILKLYEPYKDELSLTFKDFLNVLDQDQMNYNEDIYLLGKILELQQEWKQEQQDCSSLYQFLKNVVDTNDKDIDFLKVMLKLYIEHKDKIDNTLSYFLENSKNHKGKVDFPEVLKFYDEYKTQEEDPVTYKGFLEISEMYEHNLSFLKKTQELLKQNKNDINCTYIEFLSYAKEYEDKQINFKKQVYLFQEWKKIEATSTYAQYFDILKKYNENLDFLRNMMMLYTKWSSQINNNFPEFLMITNDHNGKLDFDTSLKIYQQFKLIEIQSTYKDFLEISKLHNYNFEFLQQNLDTFPDLVQSLKNLNITNFGEFLEIAKKYQNIEEAIKVYNQWSSQLEINFTQFIDILKTQYRGRLSLYEQILVVFKVWKDETQRSYTIFNQQVQNLDSNMIKKCLTLFSQWDKSFKGNFIDFMEVVQQNYKNDTASLKLNMDSILKWKNKQKKQFREVNHITKQMFDLWIQQQALTESIILGNTDPIITKDEEGNITNRRNLFENKFNWTVDEIDKWHKYNNEQDINNLKATNLLFSHYQGWAGTKIANIRLKFSNQTISEALNQQKNNLKAKEIVLNLSPQSIIGYETGFGARYIEQICIEEDIKKASKKIKKNKLNELKTQIETK